VDKGAHFYRCDFQVHTPRDANWAGTRAVTEDERRQYAEKFVHACRQKKLGAVAITDHHDFVMFPFIRAAAEAEVDVSGELLALEERLVVFPGLELTLGVPCQALLILDADIPTDRLPLVLEALAIEAVDSTATSLPPVERLDRIQSLTELYDALETRAWLRNRYIVFPNVTDGGHETLMRKGMQAKYKKMPCVGGYLDGTVDTKVGTGNKRIFDGLDSNWGNHRIALFQTSDSRADSFEDLGKHSTWVKWATPTAEALRQACLAQESRISQTPPAMPFACITRLSVSNSKFMGPIELELNPQYNAVIGGRGTGKSTVLEYIRWGLCDQQRGANRDDEINDPASRQRRLINETLAAFDSRIDVHLLINGIPHVVRRSAKNGEVQIKVSDGHFEPATESDARALLPVHAYSQKQLSSVAVRLDELTNFVTAPIREILSNIDTKIENLSGRIRQNYASLRRHRLLEANISRSEMTLASLTEQARNVRASIQDLSADDQKVLAQKPTYDTAGDLVDTLQRRLTEASEAADRFERDIDRLANSLPTPDNSDMPYADGLRQLSSEIRSIIDIAKRQASEAAATLRSRRNAGSQYETLLAAWNAARQNYEGRYAAVRAASSAHESRLHQLAELEERQAAARRTLTDQREELGRLGDPAANHLSLREQWVRLLKDRSDSLDRRCAEIMTLSDNMIRAGIKRAGALSELSSRIRAAASGSGLRSTKIDNLIENLRSADDPLIAWEDLLTELERSLKLTADSEAKPTAQLRSLLTTYGMTPGDITKLLDRLTPDSWLDLALAPLSDQPYFEYMATEGEYIDFSAASPGQQATALLRILLNQEGPPLIIDQPEDDLDSTVIQEVVSKIWKAKGRRQLIFTSHNANLVVNGDAELVISCDYRSMGDQSGGRIKLEGAIDVESVKNEITHIMEGGEKAFRLRKDKYGF
jgi:chromosome segregation protein